MTVTETLQHANVRFECLAEEFEKAGDTASWAMCSTDAQMMERALTAALSDMVVVPREPTPDMRIAGGIAWAEALPTAETYVDCADACYKAMIAAAPPQASDQVGGWQDIATAPKDGTRIFLFHKGSLKRGEGRVIGHWYKHPSVEGWITEAFDCGDYEFTPTHWQPLPAPPPSSPVGGKE